jgi:small subunit ribosomal protein S16
MSVTIRLRRVGRKKQPSYRVVVTDSSRPRDGQYIETIGFYNPRIQPAELRLDLDKVGLWVDKGAGLSDTVASLVRKAKKGGDDKVAVSPMPNAPVADETPAAE